MIVMKFGGSSLESGQAIRRVTRIVKSELEAKPVVVVSAMGKTTNGLIQLAEEAKHGRTYPAWKQLKELWDYHFDEAAKISDGESLGQLENSLRNLFRELNTIMVDVSEEGRELTPALKDEIMSFGERLSSEVMTAALRSAGVDAAHLDARTLILTDDKHTHATPLYWETYAKLRRVVPQLAADRVVVMGGFIGATGQGVTTTLGRGGSDLTATIVGAGISANEIQIWTDVDGMLTCDPRVVAGGYRVRSISYEEAGAMAHAGAKVLHPDTVAPAIRQRIPVVIRNSRKPQVEGTRIVASPDPCSNVVKSIACKRDLTILEVRPQGAAGPAYVQSLMRLCDKAPAEFVAQVGAAVFVGIKNSGGPEHLRMDLDGCAAVHLRTDAAVITLVGQGLTSMPGIAARALAVLKNPDAVIASDERSRLAISIILPQRDLQKSVESLHKEFFRSLDPRMFASSAPDLSQSAGKTSSVPPITEQAQPRRPRLVLVGQH
jgi:aspartate kinase